MVGTKIMETNLQLIETIEKFGWTLSDTRLSPYEFHQSFSNSRYWLKYNRHSREWRMTKNDDRAPMFLGQDAEPEEIVRVLGDLNIAIKA